MRFENVNNFYQTLVNSEHFSENIKNKLQSIHDEEKYKIFIQDELIPLAKTMGYNLSVDDILAYEHQKLQQLTKEELENVTGGNDLTKRITTTFMSVLAIAGGVNFTQAIHTATAMTPTARLTSRVVSDTKQSTKNIAGTNITIKAKTDGKNMSIIDVNNGIPTSEQVTAIVNPLSLYWMSDPHGGTCGAILHAAGFDTVFNTLRSTFHVYHTQSGDIHGRTPLNDTAFTAMTDGFNLRTQGITNIIHTVGPDRVSGTTATQKQKEDLMKCYRNCLEVAMKRGIRKIAFPSIATGALNFPPREAAQIAMETVRDFVQLHPRAFDSIQWVLWDDTTYNTYADALSKI